MLLDKHDTKSNATPKFKTPQFKLSSYASSTRRIKTEGEYIMEKDFKTRFSFPL